MRRDKALFEIREVDDKELLSLAKKSIDPFPILKKNYDEDFLLDVIRHKHKFDNLLLVWLVNPCDPIGFRLFQDIEKYLTLFQTGNNFKNIKVMLRQWKTDNFEHTITVLEFASEYLRKGYLIELETKLPNNKTGDFCACKDSLKIFFEVKTIFKKRSLEVQALENELEYRYSKMDEPYSISIELRDKFIQNQTVDVSRYIQKKLMEIRKTKSTLPLTFVYPENNEPIVTVKVRSRLPDGEKGYIFSFLGEGGVKVDWTDIRRKIQSGVSQLHPDYPGVIIVAPHGLETNQYGIENAIFGDLKTNLIGKPRLFRSGDRIFHECLNRRLSAVIYYNKILLHESDFTRKKFVYHNLNAARKLSADIFKGKNVIQFEGSV